MTTDKTGAPTTVTQESDRFSISVNGQKVGFVEFGRRSQCHVVDGELRDELHMEFLATSPAAKLLLSSEPLVSAGAVRQ